MELRVIHDAPADGAWNMSLDEALFGSAARGQPTLRFYQWIRPTLSLGYFQRVADRTNHSASQNIPLVRRSTGGGAIVHDRELTYSITAPLADFRSAAATRQLYDLMHHTGAKMLSQLGVPSQLWAVESPQNSGCEPFLCFQRRAEGDVVAGDRKVLGSAQRRARGAVLQHGSLILAPSAYAPEIEGFQSWLKAPVDLMELADRWTHLLGMELAASIHISSVTDEEHERAELIQVERFQNPAWTLRR